MRIICSYCKKEMGEKEPFDDDSVSHIMCSECFDYFEEQIKGLSLERYLDKFKAPIIIVDAEGRILASNKMSEKMTGKSRRGVFGLLGGEAMECAYARLPGGCGKTVHCETCTIRRTVTKAMDKGEPQLHVPVTLKRADREIKMIISTDKIDKLVRIVIEKVT
jgi:PAS domain-containing protein